jgi:diguanylate cyclase (GGDEF)-like protein
VTGEAVREEAGGHDAEGQRLALTLPDLAPALDDLGLGGLLIAPTGMVVWANGVAARLLDDPLVVGEPIPPVVGLRQQGFDDEEEVARGVTATQCALHLEGIGPGRLWLLRDRAVGAGESHGFGDGQLRARLLRDPLTGLPNRALLLDRIDQALERSRRTGQPVALLFCDLDRFKHVNDAFGHHVGDEVLRAFAELIGSSLRAGDTLARLGGDEFVVCCEQVEGESEAVALAQRILVRLQVPFRIGASELQVRTSIGVVLSEGRDAPSADELLRDADAAMYEAKARGRGRIEVFDDLLSRHVAERRELERSLATALRDGDLRVHLQPEVALGDGRLVGFEALVRWQHPERGLLAPDAFVPLAEESGLISELGGWVLREACSIAMRAPTRLARSLSVSVNVSGRQLVDEGLVDKVRSALEDTGLPPAQLLLEIPESAFLSEGDGVLRALEGLKGLGVRLALDDFGAGFSSLASLKRLPVDVLKIDRRLIDGLEGDAADGAVVSAAVAVAHALGKQASAEGVETHTQHVRLHDLGCDEGQGFLWSKPLPPQEAHAWAEAYEAARPGRRNGRSRVRPT